MADEELTAKLSDLLRSRGPPDGPLKESDVNRVLKYVNILVHEQLDDAELLEAFTESELRGLKILAGVAKTLKKAFPETAPSSSAAGSQGLEVLQSSLNELKYEVRQMRHENQQMRHENRQMRLENLNTQQLVQMMLRDQMGPASHSSKSSHNEGDYRQSALQHYLPALYPDKKKPDGKLRCMLLGYDLDDKEVVAAHIHQTRWSTAIRVASNLEKHQGDNLLLLVKTAERRFHNLDWMLKPLPPCLRDVNGKICEMHPFEVVVLNPELLRAGSKRQTIASHIDKVKTWADVNGNIWYFPKEHKPSRRACGIHATMALHYAKGEGWLEKLSNSSSHDISVDPAAWNSPTFNLSSINTFLRDAVAVAIATPGGPSHDDTATSEGTAEGQGDHCRAIADYDECD